MTTIDTLVPVERPKRTLGDVLVTVWWRLAGLVLLGFAYALASAAVSYQDIPLLPVIAALCAVAFLCGGVLLLIAPTRVQEDK